jgi:hypothetical protein
MMGREQSINLWNNNKGKLSKEEEAIIKGRCSPKEDLVYVGGVATINQHPAFIEIRANRKDLPNVREGSLLIVAPPDSAGFGESPYDYRFALCVQVIQTASTMVQPTNWNKAEAESTVACRGKIYWISSWGAASLWVLEPYGKSVPWTGFPGSKTRLNYRNSEVKVGRLKGLRKEQFLYALKDAEKQVQIGGTWPYMPMSKKARIGEVEIVYGEETRGGWINGYVRYPDIENLLKEMEKRKIYKPLPSDLKIDRISFAVERPRDIKTQKALGLNGGKIVTLKIAAISECANAVALGSYENKRGWASEDLPATVRDAIIKHFN